jgi:hypothetical protein
MAQAAVAHRAPEAQEALIGRPRRHRHRHRHRHPSTLEMLDKNRLRKSNVCLSFAQVVLLKSRAHGEVAHPR